MQGGPRAGPPPSSSRCPSGPRCPSGCIMPPTVGNRLAPAVCPLGCPVTAWSRGDGWQWAHLGRRRLKGQPVLWSLPGVGTEVRGAGPAHAHPALSQGPGGSGSGPALHPLPDPSGPAAGSPPSRGACPWLGGVEAGSLGLARCAGGSISPEAPVQRGPATEDTAEQRRVSFNGHSTDIVHG